MFDIFVKTMEQRFGTNRIDIEMLREFCKREGEKR